MCITTHTQHPCTHLTHTKHPCAERLHYERSSDSSFYPYNGACVGVRYFNKTDPNLPGGEPWETSDTVCNRCAIRQAQVEMEAQAEKDREAAREDLLQEQRRRKEKRRREDEDDGGADIEQDDSPSKGRGGGKGMGGQTKGGGKRKAKGKVQDSGYLSRMDGAADADDKVEADTMDWEPEQSFVRAEKVGDSGVRDTKGGFVEKEIEGMKEFQQKPCCASTCKTMK